MNEPSTPTLLRRALGSLGAVLAGILASIVLVGAIEALLRATGIYPPMFQPMADHQWAIALALRVAFAVVGGLLTARLAPAHPMVHAMILGCIATILSGSFVLINWSKGPEFGPHWFSIAVIISNAPLAVLGGSLVTKRSIPAEQ